MGPVGYKWPAGLTGVLLSDAVFANSLAECHTAHTELLCKLALTQTQVYGLLYDSLLHGLQKIWPGLREGRSRLTRLVN